MMGRRHLPVAPCDEARSALVSWVRARLSEHGVSYAGLAADIRYDRSWISRALSGRRMPPWPMIMRIAERCGASIDTARRQWEAADATRRARSTRDSAGHPPPDLADYRGFIAALRQVVDRTGMSHRDLVRRDHTGILRRSTVGAVLRMERSARRDMTIALITACGVSEAAIAEWAHAWDRVGRPNREAMDQRRRQIAHAAIGWPAHGGRSW